MTATTYDQKLVSAIQSDGSAIVAQCQLGLRRSLPALFISYYAINAYWRSRRMLARINKLEKICASCKASAEQLSEETSCYLIPKKDIENIVTCLRMLTQKDDSLPSIVRRINRDILERYEDKLEDYWLASDQQMKDLVVGLSNKLSRKHAAE